MGRRPEQAFVPRKQNLSGQQTHEKMLNITNHQVQIQTIKRDHSTPVKKTSTSTSQDVEKKEIMCTDGVNVNWCGHCKKQYGVSSNIYDPTPIVVLFKIDKIKGCLGWLCLQLEPMS